MMQFLFAVGALCTTFLLGVVLLVVVLVTQGFANPMGMQCTSSRQTCLPSAALTSVALAAQTLQEHVFGQHANQYDASDELIQRVLPYWMASCSFGGQLCPEAQSGNLQCVEFVSGAFFLGGDPLPATANVEDLWPLYQHRDGWTEIPATVYPPEMRGLPLPGDMMVWRGGGHLEDGQYVEYGHVAVVIAVSPPQVGQDGFVTVAEGNAPGNRWVGIHTADPGNWYTMPLHPDLSVDTWGAFTDAAGTHYDGYAVLGYIRQSAPPATVVQGKATDNDTPTVIATATIDTPSMVDPLIHAAVGLSNGSGKPTPRIEEKRIGGTSCLDGACSSTISVDHRSPQVRTQRSTPGRQ